MESSSTKPRGYRLMAALVVSFALLVLGCADTNPRTDAVPPPYHVYPQGSVDFVIRFDVGEGWGDYEYWGGPVPSRPGDVYLSFVKYPVAEQIAVSYVPIGFFSTGFLYWEVASDRVREELARFLQILDSERTAALYRQRLKPTSPEDALRLGVSWLYPSCYREGRFCPFPVWQDLGLPVWVPDDEATPPEPAEVPSDVPELHENDNGSDEFIDSAVTPFWASDGGERLGAEEVVKWLQEFRREGDDTVSAFLSLCLSDVYGELGRYEDARREAEGVKALEVSDSLKWSALVRQVYCLLALGRPRKANRLLFEAVQRYDVEDCPGNMLSMAGVLISDALEHAQAGD